MKEPSEAVQAFVTMILPYVEAAASGTAVASLPDELSAAATAAFLQENLDEVLEMFADRNVSMAALIGVLQKNAFLTAVQVPYNMQMRSRCSRWAGFYTQLRQDTEVTGLLPVQLGAVGVRIEDDFSEERAFK